MEKEIGFSGINLTPYTDICPDGQLTYSHGLEMHNGSVRPSLLAGRRSQLTARGQHTVVTGYVIQAIHKTSAFTHLICTSPEGLLAWGEEGDYINLTTIGSHNEIKKVTSVGNTLIVLTDNGCAYYLWANNAYTYIGDEIPELNVIFSLMADDNADDLTDDDDDSATEYPEDEEETSETVFYMSIDELIYPGRLFDVEPVRGAKMNATTASTYIQGKISEYIEKKTEDSYFLYPFFVRCAYRLFDGTTWARISHPILMVPTTKSAWYLISDLRSSTGQNGGPLWRKLVEPEIGSDVYPCHLCLKIKSDSEELLKWKDIITSIDIFVTPQTRLDYPEGYVNYVTPLYETYGTAEGIFEKDSSDNSENPRTSTRAGLGDGIATLSDVKDSDFLVHDYTFTSYKPTSHAQTNRLFINMSEKSEKTVIDELINNSQFYKVSECTIDDFVKKSKTDSWYIVNIRKGTLTNLVQKDMLDDSYDYHAHDTIVADNTFVYNQRLHLFDVKRRLFEGFSFPYTNQYAYGKTDGTVNLSVYVNGGDGLTRILTSSYTGNLLWPGLFFYYPNSNAYQIEVDYNGTKKVFSLTSHPYLQGAYYLAWPELGDGEGDAETSGYIYDRDNTPIKETNKIYLSASGNPYVFPLKGISNVGVGSILGLSTIATPLSQGQFGQFQLLAFCDDGNYALSVDDEGYYTSVSPLQRDKCTVPSSITQTDHEVIFISARGVMMTDGTNMRCISQVMDGLADTMPDNPPKPFYFPLASLSTLISTSLVVYDYPNQRFIFFKDRHAYLLNLTDNTWSTANFGNVVQVLNLYPDCYVQFDDDSVLRLCRDGETDVSLIAPYVVHDKTLDGQQASTLDSDYTDGVDGGGADSTYEEYSDYYPIVEGGDASAEYGAGEYEVDNVYNGVLFTRPVKLDTYLMKRISQIAVQGLYRQAQTVYVYASQDGVKWFRLGMTRSPRVRMMGKVFKYFRFAILTHLRKDENISGIRIDYDVMKERRYR